MMSLGVFMAEVGPMKIRVIALAGPGGATDPRSRGFSALNYVGTDQLDPDTQTAHVWKDGRARKLKES